MGRHRVAASLLLLLPACASHPTRVTDLATGKIYYTKEIRRGLASGKVRFTDVRTGEERRIVSSKIERISQEELDAAIALSK
jgi:hypothetical protein